MILQKTYSHSDRGSASGGIMTHTVALSNTPPDYPRDALLSPSTVSLEGRQVERLSVLPGKSRPMRSRHPPPCSTYPLSHEKVLRF
jgi:hypothetical protein